MEKSSIAKRLKKYLFFISIIFIVLTTIHLIYSYIYSDAKETAIKGGTISEAIIGELPSLNPLKNKSEQDKYLNSILYRSLLKYDVQEQKIIGDLANCNISNLLEVECFLHTNIKWSNGEDIQKKDILQTYKTLKGTNINPIMYLLLKNVTIIEKDNSIVFKNTKKDINFLKIFFQPIVSSKILNIISEKELNGSFSLPNGIYSGKYKVLNISEDKTIGINTITLGKNTEYYKNPVYIETILLKVFPNISDFLKNKNSVNIFNDKDNLITGSIPRLQEYQYTLPQYVSAFINTKKINNLELRKALLEIIDTDKILLELGKKHFKKVSTPFLSNNSYTQKKGNKSLEEILNKKGYFKKGSLIKILETKLEVEKVKSLSLNKQTKNISGEAIVKEKIIITAQKKENPKSRIITSPSWVDTYNFVSNPNITLKGKVSKNTGAVYINDLKIPGYKARSRIFTYKLASSQALKKGQNSYKIYYTINGQKKLQEELFFFFNSDKIALKKKEVDFFTITSHQTPVQKDVVPTIAITNTGTTFSSEYNNIKSNIEKFAELDNNVFYNNEGEAYTLEIYYVGGKIDYEKSTLKIKEFFLQEGVQVNLREISTQNLNKLLSEGKKNYDLLIAGVNLSYFDFNIYPYYHSSQIKSGYNFSNFKLLDLDISLEKLKSKILDTKTINSLENNVIKIISDNALSKTLYTPILSNLVDKNIKGYKLNPTIPENIYRFNSLQKTYVKENKVVIMENKNISGYIKFLFETLF